MLTITIQPIGLFIEISITYKDKTITYEIESVYSSDKFMISYITYHLSKLKS
jgi:hypothetical protein